MRNRKFAGYLLTTVAALALTTAQAQNADNTTQQNQLKSNNTSNNFTNLDPVTVYATRSPQSTFDLPGMVSTIDNDAPGIALASDLNNLFQFTPGVQVGRGPRRNGQSIKIRGFDDDSMITLIDGRRQNFDSSSDGQFFIEPALVKRTEVVKGPGSAVYGSGALGGVVSFETKDAADFLAPGETKGAFSSLSWRSANSEFSPTLTGYGRTGNVDYLGSFVLRDSGHIKQGDNRSRGERSRKLMSDDKILSGLVKVSATLNDFHTLKFSAQRLNNKAKETLLPGSASSTSNRTAKKDITDEQFGVKYAFESPDNNWLNPNLHLYRNKTEVKKKYQESTSMGRSVDDINTRSMTTVGFAAGNQTELNIANDQNHVLSYGIDYYRDKQIGTLSGYTNYRKVPDATAKYQGFYLQDEMTLKTSVGDFLAIPAVRYDSYKSGDKFSNRSKGRKAVPKFSLSWKPTKNFMLFGSWAQAFRAPRIAELYVQDRGSFYDLSPNVKLKPETVTTREVGAGVDFGSVLATGDRIKLKGSYFNSTGKDFITTQKNGPGRSSTFRGRTITIDNYQYTNVARAKIIGAEAELQYQLSALTASTGISWVEAENKKTGEYLNNSVPVTLTTDINYRIASLESLVGWRAKFTDDHDKVPGSENRQGIKTAQRDGYALHDLYYRWAPQDKDLKSLVVDLGVENLLDRGYTKDFTSLTQEGRSFVAKASYKVTF